MKKILLLGILWISTKGFCQENSIKKDNGDYDLFISSGVHVGLWNLLGNKKLSLENTPYNIHIDKVFKEKYAIGLGYSHDKFETDPIEFYAVNSGNLRQNIRIRYYKYVTDYAKTVSLYLGASGGCSIWSNPHNSKKTYWPTAQFLFGIKIKLTSAFFWQTEFGVGPPQAIQTSLGIKF